MATSVQDIVHKVTVCSHDRVNPNSDTSDFTVNIEQIPNVKKFCLRHALLPLSSYTFETGDIDSTLRVENLGVNPNGLFQIGGESIIYVNGFVIPTSSGFDPTQTFPPGGANSQLSVATTFYTLPAGQKIMMYSQLDREPLKLFSDIPGLINNTANDVYLSSLEVITALNGKLDDVCRGILGANYNQYVTIHASNYSYPPFNLELYDVDVSNIDTRKPFLYSVWGLPNDQVQPIGIFMDFDLYIAPIADTSANRVKICTFSNKYVDGRKQTVDCEQPVGFIQTNVFQRTLTAGVVYNRTSLLAMLNGLFTEQLFAYVGSSNVLQVSTDTTDPAWSKGTLSVFTNSLLGFTSASTVSGYNIDFTNKSAVAQTAIDLAPGIEYFSIKVSSDVAQAKVEALERTVNLALEPYGIEFKTKLRYSAVSPRLNINALSVSLDATYSVSPNCVYGFRLKANTASYASAELSGSAISTTAFPDPQTFYDNYTGFAYYNTNVNAWAVSQFGYSQSLPQSTLSTYQFPVDEPLQIADIQTVLNTLTDGLTATISSDKNVVVFGNSSARTFRILPNHKLGIYNTSSTAPDQSIYITGNVSNVAMTNPVDLTARNMCMSIGLSIYHDGRTGTGLGSVLDRGIPRPLRRNIVATVYNGTNVNYGQMISYSNPSDTWLPSYYRNITQIGVQIFNDKLQPINLHQKDLHLEIDILSDGI